MARGTIENIFGKLNLSKGVKTGSLIFVNDIKITENKTRAEPIVKINCLKCSSIFKKSCPIAVAR